MITLADAVRPNLDPILDRWAAEIQGGASAFGLTRVECEGDMRAHLVALLGRDDKTATAEEHVRTRLRQGFELADIVEEFALLGRVISRVWAEHAATERPDPTEVERFYADLHASSKHAALVFEDHMFDDEQREKRYERRLDLAVTRKLRDHATDDDYGPALGVIAEAVGATAAAFTLQRACNDVLVSGSGSTTVVEALTAHLRSVAYDGRDSTAPFDSAIASADESLRSLGVREILVTRLASSDGHRLSLCLGSEGRSTFTARDVRRIECLGERFAWHLERSRLHADLSRNVAALRKENRTAAPSTCRARVSTGRRSSSSSPSSSASRLRSGSAASTGLMSSLRRRPSDRALDSQIAKPLISTRAPRAPRLRSAPPWRDAGSTMDEHRILIVDDDADLAHSVAEALTTARWQCDVVTSGQAALAACRQLEFDVVVTDLRMDGMDGHELLGHLQRLQPELPVILLTGDRSVPSAVSALKRGAYHYLTKPVDGDALRDVVTRALASRPSSRGRATRRPPALGPEGLIGNSPAMVELRARIELVGRAAAPVLVHGETGTGKELVARAIHACSARRARPFVSVNASAIPEHLLESEMFGHARGAFTGAAQSHRGLFTEADGGTLLLDEIGDMPLPLQAKLLRVLQSGEVRSLGAERTTHVDVRVIAATHRNLSELVDAGRFREDLFYRLNVVTIDVPPLRARKEDIRELAAFFFARARARAPESPATQISPALLDALTETAWPGNVRELENAMERLVVLATHEELTMSDLPLHITKRNAPASAADGTDPDLEHLIQRHVERILAKTNGNKAHAAKLLGVDLSTLYRWQRKWRA